MDFEFPSVYTMYSVSHNVRLWSWSQVSCRTYAVDLYFDTAREKLSQHYPSLNTSCISVVSYWFFYIRCSVLCSSIFYPYRVPSHVVFMYRLMEIFFYCFLLQWHALTVGHCFYKMTTKYYDGDVKRHPTIIL